jgi:hypothetical protein
VAVDDAVADGDAVAGGDAVADDIVTSHVKESNTSSLSKKRPRRRNKTRERKHAETNSSTLNPKASPIISKVRQDTNDKRSMEEAYAKRRQARDRYGGAPNIFNSTWS